MVFTRRLFHLFDRPAFDHETIRSHGACLFDIRVQHLFVWEGLGIHVVLDREWDGGDQWVERGFSSLEDCVITILFTGHLCSIIFRSILRNQISIWIGAIPFFNKWIRTFGDHHPFDLH